MKKTVILVALILGNYTLNAQSIKLSQKTTRTIKIDDFEFTCDDCSFEEAIELAKESYYEALADVNVMDDNEKNHSEEFKQDEKSKIDTRQPNNLKIKRVLISKPNTSQITSEETCKITLFIKIDESGKVVGTPTVDRVNTTTSNADLINQVIVLVKAEVKYTPVVGAIVEKKRLTIQVKSN